MSLQRDGRIVKANATLALWLGYSADELTSKRLHDLLNLPGRIFYETHFAPLLRMQGFFHEVALDFLTKDGTKIPVLANAQERRDKHGDLLFTRLTIFKATERRRYERELVEARTAAIAEKVSAEESLGAERRTAELREQFIAVLGHDLRNPLSSINAGMRLLIKQPQNERSAMVIKAVEGSVTRMARLIDDVLDFARGRLGGGIKVVEHSDQQLGPLLEPVIEELRASHPDRTINSHFDLSAGVRCDPGRMRQLLSNLVGNALKHGADTHPINIQASISQGTFELSVTNAGEPIPPEAMTDLFEPFVRQKKSENLQGLGLGLYICSEIAKAHDGTLTATSSPTETRFTLRMPAT